MYLGIVLVAWADGFERIGWVALVVLGAVAALVSLVDWLASLVGARSFGASWWGLAGAFLGLLAGIPLGILGIVLGPILGAILLEFLAEPDLRRAGRVGFGTMVGFVLGTALKYALAFVLLGLAVLYYTF